MKKLLFILTFLFITFCLTVSGYAETFRTGNVIIYPSPVRLLIRMAMLTGILFLLTSPALLIAWLTARVIRKRALRHVATPRPDTESMFFGRPNTTAKRITIALAAFIIPTLCARFFLLQKKCAFFDFSIIHNTLQILSGLGNISLFLCFALGLRSWYIYFRYHPKPQMNPIDRTSYRMGFVYYALFLYIAGLSFASAMQSSWPCMTSEHRAKMERHYNKKAEEYQSRLVAKSFPLEVLFDGKFIDPRCVSAAMDARTKEGVKISHDCSGFRDEDHPADGRTYVLSVHSAGYEFHYEGGKSGGFSYTFVGKTAEGIILSVHFSTGGTGRFSDLGIYQRDDDFLRKVRTIAGGDRCSGGLRTAHMHEQQLTYSFNVTPITLYQHYIPKAGYRSDLGSGFANCGAVIHMKDAAVERVELNEDATLPPCFQEQYDKQIAENKILSDTAAKEFMEKLHATCPPE